MYPFDYLQIAGYQKICINDIAVIYEKWSLHVRDVKRHPSVYSTL